MPFLSGELALKALRKLTAGKLIAVVPNPTARQGKALEVLAVANRDHSLVIDLRTTPLATWLTQIPILAAWNAKEIHKAFLQQRLCGPSRWACIHLSEQLLLGGRPGASELSGIAANHGVAPPPAVEDGIDALAEHARSLACLVHLQAEALKAACLQRVSKIEAAAVAPIAAMEFWGMPFDRQAWQSLNQAMIQEHTSLRQLIGEDLSAGLDRQGPTRRVIDLDSDSQLLAAIQQRHPSVTNTRRQTLADLPAPLGPRLARYRSLGKLISTYGSAFLTHVQASGRLHPTFEQIGSKTGRMSCRAPNLQAMVKSTAHRSCFRAPPGRTLIIADYAACELRILAEMSGNPVFTEAFLRNEDVHARVAESIFNKPVSKEQNPQLRHMAKTVSFGLAYGMGPAGLAQALGVQPAVAQALLEQYFKQFPCIRNFLEVQAQESLQRGYAQTLTGRRLYLDTTSEQTPQTAARIAKNMPIQGTNADIIKIALARLHRALTPPTSFIVNCIHDEIIVECATTHAPQTAEIVRQAMQAAGRDVLQTIPLTADVHIAPTWLS